MHEELLYAIETTQGLEEEKKVFWLFGHLFPRSDERVWIFGNRKGQFVSPRALSLILLIGAERPNKASFVIYICIYRDVARLFLSMPT